MHNLLRMRLSNLRGSRTQLILSFLRLCLLLGLRWRWRRRVVLLLLFFLRLGVVPVGIRILKVLLVRILAFIMPLRRPGIPTSNIFITILVPIIIIVLLVWLTFERLGM